MDDSIDFHVRKAANGFRGASLRGCDISPVIETLSEAAGQKAVLLATLKTAGYNFRLGVMVEGVGFFEIDNMGALVPTKKED